MVKVDVPVLFKMWADGASRYEICTMLGIRPGAFQHLRRKYALPKRNKGRPSLGSLEPDPTPEELAERCAAVRAKWSEEETERRRVGRGVEAVRLRSYSFNHRDFAFSGMDY